VSAACSAGGCDLPARGRGPHLSLPNEGHHHQTNSFCQGASAESLEPDGAAPAPATTRLDSHPLAQRQGRGVEGLRVQSTADRLPRQSGRDGSVTLFWQNGKTMLYRLVREGCPISKLRDSLEGLWRRGASCLRATRSSPTSPTATRSLCLCVKSQPLAPACLAGHLRAVVAAPFARARPTSTAVTFR